MIRVILSPELNDPRAMYTQLRRVAAERFPSRVIDTNTDHYQLFSRH